MVKQEHRPLFLLQEYQALGTTFWVECFGVSFTEEKQKELERGCKDILFSFEEKFSRFRETSLISRLRNGEAVTLDKDFIAMYSFAEKLSKESDGTFSLFIGNKLEEKGYGVAHDPVLRGDISGINEEGEFISLSGKESLDLGGIGKGYVIDMLSQYLISERVPYHLINGGGDMYATTDEKEMPLQVFLEHPLEEGSVIGSIMLSFQGFASSSSFKRRWKRGEKQVNHFITKDGEEVWGAIYTIAQSCTIADTLATTLLLLKDPQKRRCLSEKYRVEYFLLTDTGTEKSPLFPHIHQV